MRLPKHLPSRTIAPVENMFKTSFVAVPALSRVEPLSTSGPTTGCIKRSTRESNSESVLHVRPMVVAPTARAYSTAPSTYGVRPLAAMPTTTSRLLKRSRSQVALAEFGMIFGALDGPGQRFRPARNHTCDLLRRRIESRGTLGCIEHAKPAGRARADVNESPAAPEPIGDDLDGVGDYFGLRRHRFDGPPILAIHQADDFERCHRIEMRRVGMARFSLEMVEHAWFARLASRELKLPGQDSDARFLRFNHDQRTRFQTPIHAVGVRQLRVDPNCRARHLGRELESRLARQHESTLVPSRSPNRG